MCVCVCVCVCENMSDKNVECIDHAFQESPTNSIHSTSSDTGVPHAMAHRVLPAHEVQTIQDMKPSNKTH